MSETKVVQPGSGPNSDEVIKTGMSGLLDKALEHDDAPVTDATSQTVTTEAVTTEPTKRYIEPTDDVWVKTKIDGEVGEVSAKEFQEGIQREATWTKRMQTLAEQRRQTEQEFVNAYSVLQQQAIALEAQRQALQQQGDPVDRLAHALTRNRQPEVKPDEMATIGDIDKVLAHRLHQLNAKHQEDLATLEKGVIQTFIGERQAQVRAANASKFTEGLQKIMGDKELGIINSVVPSPEYAEAVIRFNVAKMDPKSIDQGLEFAKTYANQWASKLKETFKGNQQESAAQKARVALEPNVGNAPAPKQQEKSPTIFRKDGSVDFGSLSKRAHELAASLEV